MTCLAADLSALSALTMVGGGLALVIMRWSRLKKVLYAGPGYYLAG